MEGCSGCLLVFTLAVIIGWAVKLWIRRSASARPSFETCSSHQESTCMIDERLDRLRLLTDHAVRTAQLAWLENHPLLLRSCEVLKRAREAIARAQAIISAALRLRMRP